MCYNNSDYLLSSAVKKTFLLLSLFLILPISVNAQSCTSSEWNSILDKYNIEDLFTEMQQVVDSSPFNEILYNNLKLQYDQALTLADRDCSNIGNDKQIHSPSINSISDEIDRLEKANSQIREEERKLLWMDYENALNDQVNKCPPNTIDVGSGCECKVGYVVLDGLCVPKPTTPTPTYKPLPTNTPTLIATETPTVIITLEPEIKGSSEVNANKSSILSMILSLIMILFK